MTRRKIRYAVIGLGHIAQTAVLPAFKNAENSELVAIVSGDAKKLRGIRRRHGIQFTYSYEELDECLNNGFIDAIYLALPNHLHHSFAIRAARAGIHVLCEKPMALNSAECEEMIAAAREHQVKLMIAYRLHFEASTLKAIEIARSGQLGILRYFSSNFSFPIRDGNIRLDREKGGGPLHDIGTYCINAARNLFGEEPDQVTALKVDAPLGSPLGMNETVSATLRFPGERLASFTCSFNAAPVSNFQLVGTLGELSVENAFGYSEKVRQRLTLFEKGKPRLKKMRYDRRDQFAPELVYFSECILENRSPEPSGFEGLADLCVIEAIQKSIETGRTEKVKPVRKDVALDTDQEIHRKHRKSIDQIEPIHADQPFDEDAA